MTPTNPFSNYFDISNNDPSNLTIKENMNHDNCFIYDGPNVLGGFILSNKQRVKTILKLSFYPSSQNNKYLPRLEFRKEDNSGQVKQAKGKDVIISFKDGDEARAFWKSIHFLEGFKELVELGDFRLKYKAVSFDSYLVDFKSKKQAEKVKEIKSLSEHISLSENDIKELIYPQRRNKIHWFYALLKNLSNNEGTNVFLSYRQKHSISEQGQEAVWHHFFKNNEWIIGLNVDLKFIRDLLSEQRVGNPDSKGSGSPKVDLLGISYFTTLIELKTGDTKIFTEKKTSKSRANTWDFSKDFIEAYSQALSQRTELLLPKDIVTEQKGIIDRKINRILDPKSILIIGNRNNEFPHIRNKEFDVKSDCFERVRRDSRNIEIITYDELFERAFHMVYQDKLPDNWYTLEPLKFKNEVLKIK